MLTLVLVMNTLVALLCLVVTWKVWQLRGVLSRAADTLIVAEKSTRLFLQEAPDAIYRGQMGVYQLREQRQELKPQLQKAQQILGLLNLGQVAGYRWFASARSVKQLHLRRKDLSRQSRYGSSRLR